MLNFPHVSLDYQGFSTKFSNTFSGFFSWLAITEIIHHHIRTLRGAGLIRVIVGDDHRYELRTDAVPEAGRLLEGYLTGSETEGTSR